MYINYYSSFLTFNDEMVKSLMIFLKKKKKK